MKQAGFYVNAVYPYVSNGVQYKQNKSRWASRLIWLVLARGNLRCVQVSFLTAAACDKSEKERIKMESAEESLETLGLLAFDDVFLDAPEEALHLEFPESCGPPNFSVSRRLAELLRSIEDGDSSLIFTGAGVTIILFPLRSKT
jgi:hypothetical protein